MATLDESISEPMNPDRYDDAILRWQIKPDLEIMMPLLEDAFQPGGYPSDSAIKLAVVIGDQAMSLLEPFLLHENESRRIDIFLKICRSLEEASEITPYFNIVKQNANESTLQTLKNFSQIYLQK